MMKDQIASIPDFPRTLRKSWPIGKGKVVDNISATEEVANEAAMYNIHPKNSVKATETRIAIGATRAAPATSSDICAAESSNTRTRVHNQVV